MAAQYMDGGRLVPDPLVLEMVGERLSQPQYSKGCLFDGFPRTLQQARSLDETLDGRGTPLSMVLELKADENELIKRMLKRAAAEKRVDDNPQTITERMEVYKRQTSPLLDYYRKKGILTTIDGMGTPDEVFSRIQAAVDSRNSHPPNPTSGLQIYCGLVFAADGILEAGLAAAPCSPRLHAAILSRFP